MIPNLAEGDTVDITIRCARVFALPDPEDDPGERFWTFQLAGRLGDKPPLFSVPLDYSEVTVEHSGPEGWPPQVDDIWADRDGEHWHALGRYSDGEPVMALDADAAVQESADLLAKFSPLRLVFRREAK